MLMQPVGPPTPMITPEMAEEAKIIAEATSWEEVSEILHSDQRRHYSVDIETTATVYEDEAAEKSARIEYITAVTEMLEKWIPAIQGNKSLKPFGKELVMFGAEAFKVGRTLEESLEDAFEQIGEGPPPPDPEAEKLKAEMARDEKQFALDMQKQQAEMAAQQQSMKMEAQSQQLDMQFKQMSAQLDIMLKKMQMSIEREKLGLEQQKMAMDGQAAQEEHAMKREELQIDAQATRQKADIDRETMVFDANMKRQEAHDRREERQQMAEDRRKQAQSQPRTSNT